jgi:hypothetical protein
MGAYHDDVIVGEMTLGEVGGGYTHIQFSDDDEVWTEPRPFEVGEVIKSRYVRFLRPTPPDTASTPTQNAAHPGSAANPRPK